MDVSQIGKRAWSYAGVLQDAGMSCFEYVEQLTLLLSRKMEPGSLLDQGHEPHRHRFAARAGYLADEIADDLEAALEQFTKIAARLKAQ